MSKTIVIALGGNAIGTTHNELTEAAKKIASSVVRLKEQGYSVAITHGNGPQLGMVNDIIERLSAQNPSAAEVPFSARIAMTQLYIGGALQNAISAELEKLSDRNGVASIITEVLTDENDPAFAKPTKPIGKFMGKEEAQELSARKGVSVMEDAGRGYRIVVPSPLPCKILKLEEIRQQLDEGKIVISCGGAGIPVIRNGDNFKSIPAVIDKDYASALLAQELDADILLILTGVEQVTINYRKENETPLGKITVCEAQRYIDAGQFAEGSMKPKMQAAVNFAKSKQGRVTVITTLDKAFEALKGKTGTKIIKGTSAKGRFCL